MKKPKKISGCQNALRVGMQKFQDRTRQQFLKSENVIHMFSWDI